MNKTCSTPQWYSCSCSRKLHLSKQHWSCLVCKIHPLPMEANQCCLRNGANVRPSLRIMCFFRAMILFFCFRGKVLLHKHDMFCVFVQGLAFCFHFICEQKSSHYFIKGNFGMLIIVMTWQVYRFRQSIGIVMARKN